MSPPLKRGMTAAALQFLGISDEMKERLNRLVIGVATMAADNFRKRGSGLSSPADLYGVLQLFQNICDLDLGEGEAGEARASSCEGCGAVGRGWGSQEESMASRREMLIEIFDYHGFIGGDRVT